LSIVNITIGKDRALVGCDTACQYGDDLEDRGEMSKLLVLHGSGGVLAYRGKRAMFERIFTRLSFGREPGDFDALLAHLPMIIGTSAGSPPSAVDLQLELYAVGWSGSRGRMAGAVYVIDAAGALTDAQVDTWQCANSPELPEDPDPMLDSPAAMFAHAQRQTAYGKHEFPGQAIGGRFFVADVTKERITVAEVERLS
jgi:hypothetical protein